MVIKDPKKKAIILALRLVYLVEKGRWKEALSILHDLKIEIEGMSTCPEGQDCRHQIERKWVEDLSCRT